MTFKSTIFLLAFFANVALIAQNPIRQLLSNHQSATGVPAIALGIVDQGEVVGEYFQGQRKKDSLTLMVDSNTVFSAGSVSKLITTTAVLCLVRDQQLNLLDNASDILGYGIDNISHSDRSITIEDLLTHRSSIRDEIDTLDTYLNDCSHKPDLDSVVYNYLNVKGAKFSLGSFFITAPGQTQAYSNMNFVVLAAIVEKVSGLSFEAYCQREIFEPLCMEASFWWPGDIPESHYASPHVNIDGNSVEIPVYCLDIFPTGQFSARLKDFLLFSRAFVTGSSPILSDDLIDKAFTKYYFDQFTGLDQGLGWFHFRYNGADWWGHNGAITGVNANFFWNWKDDRGIILLENQDQPTDDLLFDLLDEPTLFLGTGSVLGCSTVGISDSSVTLNMPKLYPNPAGDFIHVDSPNYKELYIINALGMVVTKLNQQADKVYVGDLQPGIYWVKKEGERAIRFVKK